MSTELIIMLICLAFSAFFSGTETAFTSFNRTKMKNLAADGNRKAVLALDLADNYDKMLTTLLVGNNVVNILLSSMATVFFMNLLMNGPAKDYYTTISTAVITIVVLIFGEISPKSLAKEHAEGYAMAVARFIKLLMVILTPVNWVFSLWKKLLSKVFKAKNIDTVTEGEVLTLVDEAHEDGSIDEYGKEIIENIFDFDDISAGEIATHRTDLTVLFSEDPIEEWDKIIVNSRFSRYPICGENIDDIIGVLDARAYLRLEDKTKDNVMESAVIPAYFVPETVKADILFQNMRTNKEAIAIVLDEYGGVCGIVTMTDLIECLIGEIDTEEEAEEETTSLIEKVSDVENAWIIFGSALIADVEETLEIKLEDCDAETFSGYVLGLYGSIPEDGSTFEISTDLFDIDIREIKEHKIESTYVILKQMKNEEAEEENVSASST
ncbi:MAG: HlyC/CorC family transporter [Ruminococcaceae bacterium]|nr:HlyC/CorC family transporter [Oscillospiraceae bacterium]